MYKQFDSSVRYSTDFDDSLSDTASVQVLLESEVAKKDVRCRKAVIGFIILVLIFALVLTSALLVERRNRTTNSRPSSSQLRISPTDDITIKGSHDSSESKLSKNFESKISVTFPLRNSSSQSKETFRPMKTSQNKIKTTAISNRFDRITKTSSLTTPIITSSTSTLDLRTQNKSPSQVFAQIGDWVVFNCGVDLPDDQTVQYIVQWWRNEKDTPIYISYDNYPPYIAHEYMNRVALLDSSDQLYDYPSLNLSKVTANDSGSYHCEVFVLDPTQISSKSGTSYHLNVTDISGDENTLAMKEDKLVNTSTKPPLILEETTKQHRKNANEIKIIYKVIKGYSCGGKPIRKWKDGSHAFWGMHIDLSKCKDECNKHTECEGFVAVHSTGICGHWKSGPLTMTEQYGKDRDCYVKKNSSPSTRKRSNI